MMFIEFDSNIGMSKFHIVSQLIIQMEEHEIGRLVFFLGFGHYVHLRDCRQSVNLSPKDCQNYEMCLH